MDPRAYPYAPGAGTPSPELAGRDAVLADARLAIQRNKAGRSARSFMFVGLRGVGKTVLLNEVQDMAEVEDALTNFIEVANNEPLSITVIATLRSIRPPPCSRPISPPLGVTAQRENTAGRRHAGACGRLDGCPQAVRLVTLPDWRQRDRRERR